MWELIHALVDALVLGEQIGKLGATDAARRRRRVLALVVALPLAVLVCIGLVWLVSWLANVSA